MVDAPSEHSDEQPWLVQLEPENKILLDQAVVTKQAVLKHAEQIRKLERTMREIWELKLEARQEEEKTRGAIQKPMGPTP